VGSICPAGHERVKNVKLDITCQQKILCFFMSVLLIFSFFWGFLLFTKINKTIGTNRSVTSKLLKHGLYKMPSNVQNMHCAFNVFEKSAPTTQLKQELRDRFFLSSLANLPFFNNCGGDKI
jgi:hypothetical protein